MKLRTCSMVFAGAALVVVGSGCKRSANEEPGTTQTSGARVDESAERAGEKAKTEGAEAKKKTKEMGGAADEKMEGAMDKAKTRVGIHEMPPSEGTLQVKIGGGAARSVDYAMKGDKVKLSLSSTPNNPKEGLDAIIDTSDHTATVLMNDKDEYAEVDLDRLRKAGREAIERAPKLTMTKSGKTDTVAGTTCEEIRLQDARYDVTACVVKGGPTFDLSALEKKAGFTAPAWLGQMVEEGYVPLRVSVNEKGKAGETKVASTTVTDFAKTPVPDAAFDVPKNYKKTTIPGLPAPAADETAPAGEK